MSSIDKRTLCPKTFYSERFVHGLSVIGIFCLGNFLSPGFFFCLGDVLSVSHILGTEEEKDIFKFNAKPQTHLEGSSELISLFKYLRQIHRDFSVNLCEKVKF